MSLKLVKKLAVVALLAGMLMVASFWIASANPPADPYADAVDLDTGAQVLSPQNALGAPDGNLVSV